MLMELATRFVVAVEKLADAQTRIAENSAYAASLSERLSRVVYPHEQVNIVTPATVTVTADLPEPPVPVAPTPTPVAAEPPVEGKPKRARKPATPKTEPAPVAPADAPPRVSRDEVQADIIRLAGQGHRSKIIQIMQGLGFDRLSKCPDDQLAALASAIRQLEPVADGGADPEVF